MWLLCFLPGCELQGHSRPVLPLGVRQVVPKSVLGLKLLGIDEPGLQGPSLWL